MTETTLTPSTPKTHVVLSEQFKAKLRAGLNRSILEWNTATRHRRAEITHTARLICDLLSEEDDQ